MSDEILRTLFDIKSDTGEIRGKLEALEGKLAAHVVEDHAAHRRITQLEMAGATQRGRASVWHVIAVGAGSAVGYVVHVALEFWKGKH